MFAYYTHKQIIKNAESLFFLLLLLATSFPSFINAQNEALSYSFSYQGVPLRNVIEDLNDKYELRFAYSSRFIPLEERIDAQAEAASLEEALGTIFDPLPVSYHFIGRQIVLRPEKVEVVEIKKAPPVEVIEPQTPVYRDERMEELMAARREKWKDRLPYLQRSYISNIQGNKPLNEVDLSAYRLQPGDRYYDPANDFFSSTDSAQVALGNLNDASSRVTQVSLIPFLGTNTFSSYNLTNQFSVNLLWGMNGGVQGKEFGGIANTIKGDVQGVQIAGVFNTVGDDLSGTQISGVGNFAADTVQGLQVAGVFNISGYGTAIQAASLFNIARGGFEGIQASFGFNSIRHDGNAIQLAGLYNRAGGNTKFQAATLFNVAKGDVKTGQVSFLFNNAKEVKGFQIALINKADTVSGIPIGLINIVKKGYNKAEFFGNEYLYGNFAFKIGVKKFYNIFTIGARMDNVPIAPEASLREMSWGLGYGLGTAITFSPRLLLNVEAVTMHINEKDSWTEEVNQLNQLKVLLDVNLGRRISLFAGPVVNWSRSELLDPETGELIGSSLAPESLLIINNNKNGKNHKIWVGFNAGLRF